jgi:hypothetical protein
MIITPAYVTGYIAGWTASAIEPPAHYSEAQRVDFTRGLAAGSIMRRGVWVHAEGRA